MTEKYNNIIDLPRHVSSKRPQMPVINRAAQFAPFAALKGHDLAVRETERLTKDRLDLDQYMKDELDMKLKIIVDRINDHPEIKITYFEPDPKKAGGAYLSNTSTVKKIDEYEKLVIMTNGKVISIKEIINIEGQIFSNYL